jgi:putative acetyltransferase
MIRKVEKDDITRLAEILVFNNRINYYPIFNDIVYSFKKYTVLSVSKELLNDDDFMSDTYVYEDIVIKGFICINNKEVKKLYVDHFFQKGQIGSKLLEFGINEFGANNVWVLEKNERAIRFYNRHEFKCDGKRILEEGTSEYLVHLVRN